MTDESGNTVRVELAVRSLAPGDGQNEVIARLEELEKAGAIDEFEVSVWGKRVGLDCAGARTDAGTEILETVDSFGEWADRNDLSIGAFFETKRIRSEFAGEDCRALDLPSMALAEYEDEELRWVSPCFDPATDAVYGVRDRIEVLATADGSLETDDTPNVAPPVPEE